MEIVLLLANGAEVGANGLVYALGLGWSHVSTPTPPGAVVIMIKVPWDQTNQPHQFVLKLVDGDGRDVMLGLDQAGQPAPLQVMGVFEAGRPSGFPPGTAMDQMQVINIGPGLALTPGTTYQWRLEINGQDPAVRSFFVRS